MPQASWQKKHFRKEDCDIGIIFITARRSIPSSLTHYFILEQGICDRAPDDDDDASRSFLRCGCPSSELCPLSPLSSFLSSFISLSLSLSSFLSLFLSPSLHFTSLLFQHPTAIESHPPAAMPAKKHKSTSTKFAASKKRATKASSKLPKPLGPFRFLDLPRELRDKIYKLALADKQHHVHFPLDYGLVTAQPGLILANKQIRKESLPIHYRFNSFFFDIHGLHLCNFFCFAG